MNDCLDPLRDEQLEKYLDGLLTGSDLIEFEERLKGDADLRVIVAQDRAFLAQMRDVLVPKEMTTEEIAAVVANAGADIGTVAAKTRRLLLLGLAGLAAAVACVAVAVQWNTPTNLQPYFLQRPLAELYREAVAHGFQPYYFCEDQDRFALTFRKRQNIPLLLAQTPADRRMVGLSYLGGLSRNTTAMLALVQEEPVVVFVDRVEFDNKDLATQDKLNNLHVHRATLGDLVLYEVSPFDVPKMSQFLKMGE